MDRNSEKGDRQKVAVVGSGMAGLVAAWLLQGDSAARYEVEVFESGQETSLDSASVSVLDPKTNQIDRIDVPMRAFTEGYYHNLKAMYDYLGVKYRVQPFLFCFARLREGAREDSYFVHASNNHQLPPRKPEAMNTFAYLCELLFVLICYVWFGMVCLFMPARSPPMGLCESFDQYLKRMRLPQYFVKFYLLPLMSAVTTCSHKTLLDFPAKDVVDYKKCITSGRQLVVSEGVGNVQRSLLKGLKVRYSAKVQAVERKSNGTWVRWVDGNGQTHAELFDKVILAVPPNVVSTVWEPLRKQMSSLPTTTVETVVHQDRNAIPMLAELKRGRPWFDFGSQDVETQIIYLRTSSGLGASTEATHLQPSGAMVTSCPLKTVSASSVVSTSKFTRVLRTPESRKIVNEIFDVRGRPAGDVKLPQWRNGDDGVFLVGSWCWDGMVLLEGCVVSAVRTARALGVSAPWDLHRPLKNYR